MSEVRLIDANAIPFRREWSGNYAQDMFVAYEGEVDSMPTIDAVPVVRCVDCALGQIVFAPQSSYIDPPCVDGILCERDYIVNDFTDFCSHGVRKEAPDGR